jgi:hypothetical protein
VVGVHILESGIVVVELVVDTPLPPVGASIQMTGVDRSPIPRVEGLCKQSEQFFSIVTVTLCEVNSQTSEDLITIL